jgi:hypothetical protein
MRMIKQLRSFWILCVTTIVLACASTAFAQQSYKITDLGLNKSTDNFSMVMGLNNQGWAENMDGVVNPPITSTSARLEERTVGLTMAGSTIAGKLSVWPKHLFQIQTVKTFAPSAHTLRVVRFFGNSST